MTKIAYSDPILKDIQIEDVTAYMARTCWKQETHPNDRVLVFLGQKDDFGKAIELVLPTSLAFADAHLRLSEAVNLISVVENRSPYEVIDSIRALDRDIFRQRILNGAASAGSLSLDLANRLVKNLRDFVSYAACVEEDPKPYFPKATGIGRQFAERCRFGHTFHGSFGFKIESPVPPSPQPNLPEIEPQPPFERRVMERLVRGLVLTQKAVFSGDVSLLINNYQQGFNANLCEVLLEMSPGGQEIDLEYSISWSPLWRPSKDLAKAPAIRVERKAYQYLESAARALRSVQQSQEIPIRGKIIQLRSETAPTEEDDEDEGRERTVTIACEEEQGRPPRVRVCLHPTDYRLACDAHKEGRTVSVQGKLEKPSKSWTLMAPHDFRVES